jgi:replicative DNA helicase
VERSKPSETKVEELLQWQQQMMAVHGKGEVIIGKQRHGPTGSVQLSFEAQFTRFGNLAKEFHLPERVGD